MSIPAKLTIFRNKRDEEVARVIFDENFPPGWRIESKARPSFEHKFSTEQEACNVWHHDFDPETGRLRAARAAALIGIFLPYCANKNY